MVTRIKYLLYIKPLEIKMKIKKWEKNFIRDR
jgi:hypothetical protein